MNTATESKSSLFPLELNPALLISGPSELVSIIVQESDEQKAEANLVDQEAEDFAMSCDALNMWRVYLRCKEEAQHRQERGLLKGLLAALSKGICEERQYDPEEFGYALEATKDRVRVPFGLNPLELAVRRAKRKPIKILKDGFENTKIPALIAAIALQLKEQELKSYIMLPIEQLRIILGCRKVVVSGAVMKLIKAGIVTPDLEEKYHTGKARQFSFNAVEGEDFEYVT